MKAKDYKNQKICYSELYIPSSPYFPFFWNDWYHSLDCSINDFPSVLYQSFNLFFRHKWITKYGKNSLPLPDSINNIVHIVLEIRSINHLKNNKNETTSRVIRNIHEISEAIRRIPNIRLTVQVR